jgi:hypothetical protein
MAIHRLKWAVGWAEIRWMIKMVLYIHDDKTRVINDVEF